MASDTVQHNDLNEITIRPAVKSRVHVTIDRVHGTVFDRPRFAGAVTVHGDGRVTYHDGPTDTDLIEQLTALVDDLHQTGDCRLDHHGYCQEHGWMDDEPRCPHARAQELLAELRGDDA